MLESGPNRGKNAAQPPGDELLTAIVVSSSDAIVSQDLEGNITGWNPAAEQLFGFTAQEAIGKLITDLLCPQHLRQPAIENLHQAPSEEGPLHYEAQRQKKDASLIDVSVIAFDVRNPAGERTGALAIYRDISEHKQVETELRAHLDEAQGIDALGQHALAVEELSPLLDESVALVANTLKVDYCTVLELQPDGKTFLLRTGVGWPAINGHTTVGAGQDSQAGYTLLCKEPVIVDDLRTEARFQAPRALHDDDVISGISAIIGDFDSPYGVLAAHTHSQRKFTGHDANFLQAVANVIGQAAKSLASQQEVRRSEAYFRSLIDSSFDAIVVLDPQGTICFENASVRRIFGFSQDEQIGKISFAFVHPDEVESARQSLSAALRGGTSSLECRLLHKDGTWLNCEMAISRAIDPQGRPAGVVNIRDISARKQAEQEQTFLAAIVESAHIAIIGVTQEGKVASWNRAAESAYGYTAQEITGQPFGMLLVDSESGAREMIARSARGERTGLHEAQRRRRDGQIVSLSVTESPILDKAGTMVGMASIERSPSEETRLQQALQEAHAYTRGLIESSHDAMLMVGTDLIVTDVNEQAVKLTRTARDVVIGSRFDSYFTEPERAAQGIARALNEGYIADYDLALKPASGREILVSFNASVFRDATGKPRGVFAVARDVTRQRQIEEELRQAQAYTRRLIESSLDAMLSVDRNLVITDVNEQMARMSEVPKTTLIGSRFDTFFRDPQRAQEGVRRALKDASVTNWDLTLRTPSGREILVSFNASVFYDVAGQPQGVFGVARDVTEQRRLDQRLRERQIYSRSLFESSIDALLAVSPELEITDVNEQAVRLTGYSRAELIGSNFPMLFVDPESAAQGVNKALTEGFVTDYEVALRSAAGAELLVSFNASPFKDAEGKVLGILAAVRDVSERQRLERERSLLASIVTTSPDAIYSYTPDTTVTSWNAGAERFFGYRAAEMIGRSMTIFVPLERRAEVLAHLNLVLGGKGVQRFETRRRRKDGSLVDVSVTMSAITDRQGQVTAVASIYRDITERKRFEHELTQARDEALEGARVRSEFLANMSHEVRTPLNSITGMADMLLDSALTDEQRRRLFSLKHSASWLLAVLNDILDFSKLSAGKVSFQTIDFDLEEVFHSALNPFADAARHKGLEVIVAIEPDAPQLLRGDPDRLRQVMANLISNAVKFTERGEIVIRVSRLSESPSEAVLRFEVRDTGIGIPAQAQPQLFSAFTQVEGTARQYGGTGLGLAIARQLVERMQGAIGVASTPGVGATFWFTAKLAKQTAALKQPPPAALSLEGVHALIVDHNPINRDLLKTQLRSWKMVPDTAAGPAEAMEIMCREAQQGRPYALALLDMEMPEMNGIELARRVRRLPEISDTPLALLSSAPDTPELPKLIAELDIRGFLLKPVRQSELFDCIAQTLGRSKLRPSPREAALEKSDEASTHQPMIGPHGHPLRVLLAEDDAANREVGLWQLQKLGCLADAVVNGREALEAADKTPYDVILMDCRMPTMDGYQATGRIRAQEGPARHTRIVAMTAHALTGEREKCLSAGMDDYITKPVTLESLADALRRTLGAEGAIPSPAPEAADKEADGADAPTLDPAAMASLRAKGDLLPNLINTVLGEMPEQLKQVADALAGGNHTDAAIAAHCLKGTARIFGAARMAELATAVEQAADAEAMEQSAAQLESLRQECELVLHELEMERTAQHA